VVHPSPSPPPPIRSTLYHLTTMTKAKIDYWEAAALAAAVLGVDAPETDADEAAIEEQFGEQYGIDLITFGTLAEKLVPMCAMDKCSLTDAFRKGFVRDGAYIVNITTDTP
jgi:hypothetical protein